MQGNIADFFLTRCGCILTDWKKIRRVFGDAANLLMDGKNLKYICSLNMYAVSLCDNCFCLYHLCVQCLSLTCWLKDDKVSFFF